MERESVPYEFKTKELVLWKSMSACHVIWGMVFCGVSLLLLIFLFIEVFVDGVRPFNFFEKFVLCVLILSISLTGASGISTVYFSHFVGDISAKNGFAIVLATSIPCALLNVALFVWMIAVSFNAFALVNIILSVFEAITAFLLSYDMYSVHMNKDKFVFYVTDGNRKFFLEWNEKNECMQYITHYQGKRQTARSVKLGNLIGKAKETEQAQEVKGKSIEAKREDEGKISLEISGRDSERKSSPKVKKGTKKTVEEGEEREQDQEQERLEEPEPEKKLEEEEQLQSQEKEVEKEEEKQEDREKEPEQTESPIVKTKTLVPQGQKKEPPAKRTSTKVMQFKQVSKEKEVKEEMFEDLDKQLDIKLKLNKERASKELELKMRASRELEKKEVLKKKGIDKPKESTEMEIPPERTSEGMATKLSHVLTGDKKTRGTVGGESGIKPLGGKKFGKGKEEVKLKPGESEGPRSSSKKGGISRQLDDVTGFHAIKPNGKAEWNHTHFIFAFDCSGTYHFFNA
jgi:hypothetical protein